MELRKGNLFHHRYLLVSALGAGASAEVWKAKDTKANNLVVALKIFAQHKEMDSYGMQNFEREFTTVYNLKHSNLLPPTGYDLCEGRPYLVMPYCENGSCNGMAGKMGEDDIIKFLHDVAAGLEYLHDRNIIHQDIKPDNILIDDNLDYMVTDFGISVNASGAGQDDMSGGTRAYMGPERFEGVTVSASDIWSLGATAVELLTGTPPYGDHGGLLQASGEPLPELPPLQPEVRGILLRCLEADPARRIHASEIRQKVELYWETGQWVRRSQKKLIAIVATAVASLLLCLGIFVWDYTRTKVRYYKDYVETWGVPEGVGRVSPGTASHMQRVYRFEYSRWKVRRVAHVNSRDVVIDDGESERSERPLCQDIYYSSEGKVSRIKVRDRNGKVLYVKAFNENLTTMSFQYDDQHNTERAIASSTVAYGRMLEDNSSQKGKITRWLIDYDKDGHAKTIRYAGLDNSEQGDDDNIYGRSMEYDEKGRVKEIRYLGKDGKQQSTRWGLGMKRFEYDDDDNWTRAEYYTVDGQPAYDDKDGTSIFEMEYDDNCNIKAAYHRDGDGELMLPKKNGIAGIMLEYDDNGFIVRQTCLGIDKQPIYVPSSGFASFTAKYDENGFVTEEEYYDPDGNVCETSQGNSKRVNVNDAHGNVLETWTYDRNGDLCLDPSGIAGQKIKYDSVGNIVEYINYGKDGNPVLDDNGHAGVRYKYDERNLLVELTYLGEDLSPAFDNIHVCLVRYQYDKRGNTTRIAFYDASGSKLEHSAENVAGWSFTYDDLGNETERIFFNSEGAPCEVTGGYAKKTCAYDHNGHLKAERYYNLAGKLTSVNGMAGRDYTCDERGNVLTDKPLSPSGGLAAGMQETHYKYDNLNNCTEESYFSGNKAVACRNGYHRVVRAYNTRNQLVEVTFYNTAGSLVITANEGIAKMRNEYDKRGNRVKAYYYGTDGKPIAGKEGWASSTYEYDAFGNTVKQCFFGVDGQPTNPSVMVPVGVCSYDKHNNMVYLAAQDGSGHFIINPNTGWAITRNEYDNKSQLLSSAYFDENDKPMKCKDGMHKTTYKYDISGNKVEAAYWDTDGKPMLINGIHLEKYTYDKKGHLTLYALYDQAGKPKDCAAGYQRVETFYADGLPSKRKYYKAGGSLLATQAYNKATGEWGSPQGQSREISTYSASSSDWRSAVAQMNASCPSKVADGVYVTSVVASGSSVVMTLKLANVSKYDLDEETTSSIQRVGSTLRANLRSNLQLPSNVSVYVKFIDKAGRTI